VKPTVSHGSTFVTKAKSAGDNKQVKFNHEFWKNKVCYICGKKGHPASIHSKEEQLKAKASKSKKATRGNETSKASRKSSKSQASSQSKSSNKSIKDLTKTFTTLATQLGALQEGNKDQSDLSDSDVSASAHFTCGSAMAMHSIADSKHQHQCLDMTKVILLDNQSTVDLFCNKDFVTNIVESPTKIKVKSTGGYITVHQKANVPGYSNKVWFSKDAVTNILCVKNIRKHHWITYDCSLGVYTVHRKDQSNLEFTMIDDGLHVHVPGDKALAFVNTISGNKEGFSKRQLKGAQAARELYSKLAYPSLKDFGWAIVTNQIKN
jgi:hypothetical protein